MVEKDKFDSTIESLRGEIVAIKTSLFDMENDLIQTLREKNIGLKNSMKTLEALLESFDIILNKMNQYSRRNDVVRRYPIKCDKEGAGG